MSRVVTLPTGASETQSDCGGISADSQPELPWPSQFKREEIAAELRSVCKAVVTEAMTLSEFAERMLGVDVAAVRR